MFNIITPTYNREHTLDRVYNSLLDQTYKEFVWIIVDDCSVDNTELLVEKWIAESKITIIYNKLVSNKGKGHAVNYGLDFCKLPYTIIADSDDSFVSNTLSDLYELWSIINKTSISKSIASIWTLTVNEKNQIVGDKFPKDLWQVDFYERVIKNNIDGEKWACWRTEILANTKMYAQEACYIEESQTWNKINKAHDFLCVNLAHRCYYDSPDGIIASKKTRLTLAKMKYYNSYYGLKDVTTKELISYKFYWNLAFDYISGMLFFTDKTIKLSTNKFVASLVIFLLMSPKRLISKLL
jgi:glycosyltransferase involved in cell wall biosynthesis